MRSTKPTLRILKVWSTFQTEIKYHDHYLANRMREQGHTTTFFASDSIEAAWKPFLQKHKFEATEIWSGHHINRFASTSFANKPFLKNPFAFVRAVKALNPDIIHVLGLAYPVNQLALLTALLFSKAPVFVNEHGRLAANKTNWKAKIFYWNAYLVYQLFGRKKIKAFIAPNEESKAFIIDRYGVNKEKIHIIPLGYDEDVFKFNETKRNQLKDKLIIGFAGKINAEKRVERILEALATSSNKENIICKIAGFNESNKAIQIQLEAFAREHQLHIECLPFLNSEALAEFYNYIDVAVYPGSISITTIEANACGAAILLNNSIRGLENRVEDNRGFLFSSVGELSSKLDYYYQQKLQGAINHKLIANNTSKYSWTKISQEYLNLYYQYL